MTRSEYTHNGVLTHIVYDNGDGTGTQVNYDADGNQTDTIALTGLPIFAYQSLDRTGALATLLVVSGAVSLEDASNAIHEEPDHLIAEAEAWSLGGTP